MTRKLLNSLLALAALALIAPAAHAQMTPYANAYPYGGGAPVILGYGPGYWPVGPYSYYGPVAPPIDPYSYYGNPGFGYPNPALARGYYQEANPYIANERFANAGMNPNILPRTSDTIEARRESNNTIWIGWQGDTQMVNRITFALLNKDHHQITQRVRTSPPAQIRFTRIKDAAYYRVTVEYLNGATNTVTSPI